MNYHEHLQQPNHAAKEFFNNNHNISLLTTCSYLLLQGLIVVVVSNTAKLRGAHLHNYRRAVLRERRRNSTNGDELLGLVRCGLRGSSGSWFNK